MSQAALASYSIAIADFRKSYDQAITCIKENKFPHGDVVPFVIICARTLIKVSGLLGKIDEAETTVNAYVQILAAYSDLYRSNVCNLFLLLGEMYTLTGDHRKARFSYGTYESYFDDCSAGVSARNATALSGFLTLLLEVAEPNLMRLVIGKFDVENFLKDPNVSVGKKFELRWGLLNIRALLGDYSAALNQISDEDIQTIEKNIDSKFKYPYRKIRSSLLAYAAIVTKDRQKFLQHFSELKKTDGSLPSDFRLAKLVLEAESEILNENFAEARETLSKFQEEFEHRIKNFLTTQKSENFSLRGYNKFMVGQAIRQYVRLPVKVKNYGPVNSIFKLVQTTHWPDTRFGFERVQKEILLGLRGNSVARRFLELSRSNLKSNDVASWSLLLSLADFLKSGRPAIRKLTKKEDALKGLRRSRAVRSVSRLKTAVERSYLEVSSGVEKLLPVSISKVQSNLKKGETVYVFTKLSDRVISICVSKSGAKYSEWAENIGGLDRALKIIRASVVSSAGGDTDADARFPFKESNLIYQALFQHQEECLSKSKNLFLIPPPDLLLVPYNALSVVAGTTTLKDATWFADKVPFSILTSVRSFRAIRQADAGGKITLRPKYEFLGISNPVFSVPPPDDQSSRIQIAKSLYPTRAGNNADAMSDLLPLPETEDEVLRIASMFSRDRVRILTQKNANETRLRKTALQEYRIIDFATHALVAGEFEGVNEPSIVLSSGDPNISRSDGLITASEIGVLRLNADLVILSACNTAAGDGGFASPGLSGLTNAVLAAGAKSVVATQWAVNSLSAKHVAVETSRFFVKQNLSAASSLQKAFKATRERESGKFLHPRYWAGFIVVGDGAYEPGQIRPTGSMSLDSRSNEMELLTSGDRVAEWRSVIKVPSTADDIVSSGFSAEHATSTKKRAVGIIQRTNQGGKIAWQTTNLEHTYKTLVNHNKNYFIGISQTYSETRRTSIHASKIDYKTGAIISSKLLLDSERFDSSGNPVATAKGIQLPFSSESFEKGIRTLKIGVIIFDPDTLEITSVPQIEIDPWKLTSLERGYYVSSNRPELFLSPTGLKIGLSIELRDLGSKEHQTEYGFRKRCDLYPMSLIFEVSDSIKFIGRKPLIQLLGAFNESGIVVYRRTKRCGARNGVELQFFDDFLSGEDSVIAKLDWPTKLSIAGVGQIASDIFIAGSVAQLIPFKTKPARDNTATDPLSETRRDALDPSTAFLARINTGGDIDHAYFFDDARSRSVSDVIIDKRSGRYTLVGTARGGDAWIFSGQQR